MRNFFPVSQETIRRRIIEQRGVIDSFDPAGLILAIMDEKVVGMIHILVRPGDIAEILYKDWKGGLQGVIAFIAVDRDFRKRGIGSELTRLGQVYLMGCSQVIIDGQCINPFYGNSEGPFTPFFGTPEGISIPWEDYETKEFLLKRGFNVRYKGVTMEIKLGNLAVGNPEVIKSELARNGIGVEITNKSYPELGLPLYESSRILKDYVFESIVGLYKDEVVSFITSYPMPEVGQGKFAIYETRTLDSYQGRGIGKNLLNYLLTRLIEKGAKSCEVFTIPEVSPGGLRLYKGAGFVVCAEWAIY
jgi:ribosomal protein S18 acetylase RimI-like enzyme